MRDLSPCGKGNSPLTKLFGGLSYEKIRRYNNSPPYVTARWPPQQIPPLNFLGVNLIPQSIYSRAQKKCTNTHTQQIASTSLPTWNHTNCYLFQHDTRKCNSYENANVKIHANRQYNTCRYWHAKEKIYDGISKRF